MTDLSELIERVKAATGPDRELDWRIADTTDHPSFEKRFEHMWPPFGPKSKLDRDIPAYTATIDAALALVERVLPGWMWSFGNVGPNDTCWACLTSLEGDCPDFDAGAPTPALAILAALFSVLISNEAQP